MDPEIVRALELVAEYDRQRPRSTVEYRLYYDTDGKITGYCETDHPADTNYIVLENPDWYFKQNTQSLRVIDGQLIKVETTNKTQGMLVKSQSGQAVVAGMATVAIMPGEQYSTVEYYDRPKNN